MYIIDLINLTINWHWEGTGTATRTLKINSSQRTVLNLILNILKLISAASKSWHVSQSRICIFSFFFFNWFESNGKIILGFQDGNEEFTIHEPTY